MQRPPLTINRVTVSLVAIIAYIYIVPFISVLTPYFVVSTVVLLGLVCLAAAVKRAWFDVVLSAAIASGLIIGRQIFDQVPAQDFIFRACAIMAFIGLNLTLLIGPWSRFTEPVQRLYKHRRHLGVTSFLLALTHASLVIKLYFTYSLEQALASTFVFFGLTTFMILGLLAATSFDWAQKHIPTRWWSALHGAALVAYIGLITYLSQVALDLTTWHWFVFVGFVVFWLLVAPWSLPRILLRRVNGWKQIHVLVYIGYVSLIIHVWTGIAGQQAAWVKTSFWTFVVAVVTSHAAGWIVALVQWSRSRAAAGDAIQLNGHAYQYVAAADTFISGKGQRHIVGDKPVAVFKDGNNWFAMSSVCPHQGGPIDRGTIVNGYVECPLHQWQFSVSDGSGPPGFPDCIPHHTVAVKAGKVYVAIEDSGKCQSHDGHNTFTQ